LDWNDIPRAIHSEAIERACEDDRSWFQRNPDRRFRLREAVRFEFNGPVEAPEGMMLLALVAQVESGFRFRMPVALPIDNHFSSIDDEQLGAMFMRFAPKHVRKQFKGKTRKTRGHNRRIVTL
jgi:hypothetical protein